MLWMSIICLQAANIHIFESTHRSSREILWLFMSELSRSSLKDQWHTSICSVRLFNLFSHYVASLGLHFLVLVHRSIAACVPVIACKLHFCLLGSISILDLFEIKENEWNEVVCVCVFGCECLYRILVEIVKKKYYMVHRTSLLHITMLTMI